ncbi:hypothetical protein GOV03_03900 [Candidatus Woesearchaeota archaeon]|nr:hypothetical protein [Candidatus Woesearchaeota archaeon]
MVSFKELVARTKQHFRFSKHELIGLIVGVLVTGFIFSFKEWGIEELDVAFGLKNLLIVTLAAGVSLFGTVSCQKLYALSCGYRADFKVWWVGIVVALVLGFISIGNITLVLAGSIGLSFMVRQRLGEFRYGATMEQQGIASLWGILGALIVAALFRIGSYFSPGTLFFEKGLMISLILAICLVLPLPRMEGLRLFFSSRGLYFVSVVIVVLSTLLLLFGGGWGLLLGIIIGLVAGAIAILYGSEI